MRDAQSAWQVDYRARQRMGHAALIARRPGPELRARIVALREEQEKIKQELDRVTGEIASIAKPQIP